MAKGLRGHDSHKRKQQKRITIIVAAVIVAAIIAQSQGWLGPVSNIINIVLNPIQRVVYKGGNNLFRTTSKINQIPNLSEKNTELESRVRELESQANDNSVLIKENERLRNELSLLPKEQYSLIGAHILGLDAISSQAIRTLNRGEKDGIRSGDPVIVGSGILVGKIVETTKNTATMMLLTSDESIVNINVANKEILGIVRGDHGVGLLLDLIPQQEQLEVGDQLITSGVGNDFPQQLTIGSIEELKKSDNDVFQQAFIQPAKDPRQLREVFVIRSSATPTQ